MPLDGQAQPHAKDTQLTRGQRRYRRKVASPKQWQAIIAGKGTTCRLAGEWAQGGAVEYHHLVSRQDGGDDVPDNIVPLCGNCHRMITTREAEHTRSLLANLTDDEYAYAVTKGGEDFFERAYGLRYTR